MAKFILYEHEEIYRAIWTIIIFALRDYSLSKDGTTIFCICPIKKLRRHHFFDLRATSDVKAWQEDSLAAHRLFPRGLRSSVCQRCQGCFFQEIFQDGDDYWRS
uniref:Uncharacterized protein n=1 Tax=Panagrolaimus sp. ES5 TaxID=591445 RepID=A0AC34FRC1_9BILA